MAIRCKKLHYLKLSIIPQRRNSTVRNVLRSADMFDRVIKFECGYCDRKTQKSSQKNFTFDFLAVPCRGKRLRNYLEIWRSHERLGDKSMSSRPHFSLERKQQSRSQSPHAFWSAPRHGALENNQFPETKILGLPTSRRICMVWFIWHLEIKLMWMRSTKAFNTDWKN